MCEELSEQMHKHSAGKPTGVAVFVRSCLSVRHLGGVNLFPGLVGIDLARKHQHPLQCVLERNTTVRQGCDASLPLNLDYLPKIAAQFERDVARELWGDARTGYNAPSRRKKSGKPTSC
jgi:hypothetical protein